MKCFTIPLLAVACLLVGVDGGHLSTRNTAKNNGFVAPLNVYPVMMEGKYQLESVIEIEIGTPPQKIFAAFDTGSYIPVIYNKSCTMPDCGDAVKYSTATSSTAVVNRSAIVHEDYGAGNSSGYMALDNFSYPADVNGVASNWVADFTVINYVHWRPNQAGLSKLKTSDGVFGMGPYGTGPEAMVKKFGIDMVAVRMPRGQPFTSGVAQFGGYDQVNPEQAQPTWVNRVAEMPWFVIPVQNILVDGVSTGQCLPSSGMTCEVLLDTGGAVLMFTEVGVPSNTSVSNISCDAIAMLPTIGIVIQNTTFTLEPQDYVIKLADGTCQSTIVANGNGERKLTAEDIQQKRYTSHRIHSKEDLLAADHFGGGLLMDFGVQWTSRVTTIFDWKMNRIGLIEHR